MLHGNRLLTKKHFAKIRNNVKLFQVYKKEVYICAFGSVKRFVGNAIILAQDVAFGVPYIARQEACALSTRMWGYVKKVY